jgi:hypothetical protein
VLLGGAAELAGELLAGQRDPDEDVAGPSAARLHIRIFPNMIRNTSVADPDPDPSDPYVYGPPGSGSGSFSQRYGSGSFHQQAKIVKKNLIQTVLQLLLDFLSLKNLVNVPSKTRKVISRKLFFYYFFVGILKVNDENSRIRIH